MFWLASKHLAMSLFPTWFRRHHNTSHARITEVNPGAPDPDPDPGHPDDEGDGDDNDDNNPNPGSVHIPVPEPGPKPKPEDMGKVLAKAMTHIAEFVDPDKQESSRISVKEPDQFDGSDQRKLQGFLLQLKLNFWAKKRSFWSDSDKVTYALSFLKGTALDYFKPYLTDNPDQEPTRLNDYDEFVEELMINFGPYDQVANAEVELEQLVMKDNHKATKFFVDFYRISTLLDYNNQALHQKAYLTLPKRIKDELIHFDKPRNLDDHRDLVQKIDQCYWERRSEVSRETPTIPKPDQKSDKTSKLNPKFDRKANLTPSTSGSGSKDKDKDKSKSGNQNQKKTVLNNTGRIDERRVG